MRKLCEILVAHQMGARVEISVVVLVFSAVCVTPYVGVRVEIRTGALSTVAVLVAPLQRGSMG